MNESRSAALPKDSSMRSLRVLLDGHWLFDGPPSGKTVVQGILRGWAENFPQDHVTVRLPDGAARIYENSNEYERVKGFRASNHALNVISTRANLSNYDVYISQNFGAIVGSSLRCTFLHDGIYKERPEWFSRLERLYLGLIRPTLTRNSVIFTSSQAEASRIVRLWPTLAGKIQAVGLAVPCWLREEVPQRPVEVSLEERPYILTVGRLNVRKNLRLLIQAFGVSSAALTHDLYIVGEPNGLPDADTTPVAGVRFLKGIQDGELKWLYDNAASFIFPSLDEGFGLPLVEAAYSELPIAASDIPPFREIGVANVYFDPESIEGIKNAIDELINLKGIGNGFQFDRGWQDVVEGMRSRILLELRNGK